MELRPCGTWAAAMRHYRAGGMTAVRACPLCSAAWTRHNSKQKARIRREKREAKQ